MIHFFSSNDITFLMSKVIFVNNAHGISDDRAIWRRIRGILGQHDVLPLGKRFARKAFVRFAAHDNGTAKRLEHE